MPLSVPRPSLALPEPLRAAEIPSFTHTSVAVRLPNIARRALEENSFSAATIAQIQALIGEIPHGQIRQVNTPLAPDAARWAEYIRPYMGCNWLDVPWFFAEEYFYVRILEATGYYAPGNGHHRDPYIHQKKLGLISTRGPIRDLTGKIDDAIQGPHAWRDSLERLLLADLWGNQNDLSMWPVRRSEDGTALSGGSAASGAAQEHILSNDMQAVLDYVETLDPSATRVDLLLDNAGYELVADLALADYLLASGRAAQVVLHAKTHPVFVSDALVEDVFDTLDFMALDGDARVLAQAIRLRVNLAAGKLALRKHPFWTSPLPAWELPDDLLANLAGCNLLISKGDANYRRLLGDRHWQNDLPFESVVDYFPFGVLALRTLKSEITVGVNPTRVPAADPEWMVNGRWGLVQFARPRRELHSGSSNR
jgi:hypothetical protein